MIKFRAYPKLWEASGISNAELVDVDRLIQLAIERSSETF